MTSFSIEPPHWPRVNAMKHQVKKPKEIKKWVMSKTEWNGRKRIYGWKEINN